MATVNGLDVSHYQSVDWGKVPQLGFVACKASQGTKADPTFQRNWVAMRSRGFGCRVAYHFLDKSDPAAQAVAFRTIVGALQTGETLALDFEEAGVSADHAVAFLNALALPSGHHPLVYAGEYFPGSHDARLQAYPLWMPGYTNTLTSNRHVVVWQFSSSGTVPGIAGRVDVNAIEDLGALLGACGYAPAPPAPPLVTPPPSPLPERTTLLLKSTGREVQVAGMEIAYLLGPNDPGHAELQEEIQAATFGLGFLDCVTRLEQFFGWPVTGQLIPGSSWTGLDMAFLARGGTPIP